MPSETHPGLYALTKYWDIPTLRWVKGTQPSGGGGGGACTIADGADVAQGTTTDVAWVAGAGTVISLLKKIASASAASVVSTKTALTGSAPTAGSVGVASGALVAANASRKGLVLTNTSANTVSFGLDGNAAVLNSGITLRPQQSWTMTEYTFTTGAIAAIASGAASNVAIQELT